MSTTEIQPARAHARDMTDEERQAWAEWAHLVEARVVNAIERGKAAYWDMAEALYEFEDDGGWKALGHDSLNDWLGQSSIGLRRTAYYDAIGAWKALVVERKIAPHRIRALEPSKVAVVLPSIKSGHKLTKEALDDAEALSQSDLKESYRRPKPKHADVSGQPDSPSTKNVVQVEGTTGDEAANLASNGGDPSGQVVVKAPLDASAVDMTITSVPPSDDVSPSEPQDIEGTAQDVDGENSSEAPGDEATAPLTSADVESALNDVTLALASGQEAPRIGVKTLAVVADYLNDVPIVDSEIERLRKVIDRHEVAGGAVVDAFNALPERARTKHLPKPVREAIVNLAALFE